MCMRSVSKNARGLVKHIMEEKTEKQEKAKEENFSLDFFYKK